MNTSIPQVGADTQYRFTTRDKLVGALEAVRMRLFPRRMLVAGPYVGEFGHELMEWQAVVHERVPHYEEVHVITYPGRDVLYPGCFVHAHDVPLEMAGYGFGKFPPQQIREMSARKANELGLKGYDLLTTLHVCTRHHRRWLLPQKFEILSEPPLGGKQRDLAFHFRAVDKAGPDKSKNYPTALANELTEACRRAGYAVCCIGHPQYSYCPPGGEDARSVDLRQTVAAICSVAVVIGEISGPMHLANLCGKPTVIWAADPWRIEYSLRWNHFGMPVYVAADNTIQPPPQKIKEQIDRALQL